MSGYHSGYVFPPSHSMVRGINENPGFVRGANFAERMARPFRPVFDAHFGPRSNCDITNNGSQYPGQNYQFGPGHRMPNHNGPFPNHPRGPLPYGGPPPPQWGYMHNNNNLHPPPPPPHMGNYMHGACFPPNNGNLPRVQAQKFSGQNRKPAGKLNGNQQDVGQLKCQEAFFCDACQKEFKNKHDKDAHFKSHVKCEVEGCSFIASRKALKCHFIQIHETGKFKINLQTNEDIEKWKEQRKKNYPTSGKSIEKKLADDKRRQSGGVLETKQFSYKGKGTWKSGHPVKPDQLTDELNNNARTVETKASNNTVDHAHSGVTNTVNPSSNPSQEISEEARRASILKNYLYGYGSSSDESDSDSDSDSSTKSSVECLTGNGKVKGNALSSNNNGNDNCNNNNAKPKNVIVTENSSGENHIREISVDENRLDEKSTGENISDKKSIGENVSGEKSISENVSGECSVGENVSCECSIGDNAFGENTTGNSLDDNSTDRVRIEVMSDSPVKENLDINNTSVMVISDTEVPNTLNSEEYKRNFVDLTGASPAVGQNRNNSKLLPECPVHNKADNEATGSKFAGDSAQGSRNTSKQRKNRKRRKNNASQNDDQQAKKLRQGKPTLLEMLLANDIRHERNVILQCIRHVVRKEFFKDQQN